MLHPLCVITHLLEADGPMRFLERIRLRCLETLLSVLRRHGTAWKEQPEHLRTGLKGEDSAYFYLRHNGYSIVAHRWTASEQSGDLDLIAWKDSQLCFFEVKTRTARDEFPAEVMVDREKRAILRRLARAYLRHLPGETPPPVRFDILSVYLLPDGRQEFEHFENAFGWSEAQGGRWGDR